MIADQPYGFLTTAGLGQDVRLYAYSVMPAAVEVDGFDGGHAEGKCRENECGGVSVGGRSDDSAEAVSLDEH